MKIVSWNCNGAFRNKLKHVSALTADIILIQECENPNEFGDEYKNWAGDYLWKGENKNKGIGVFAKNGYKISELNWNGTFEIKINDFKSISLKWLSSDLKLFLPFMVNDKFTFLGVWTKGKQSEVFGYIGQFWKYLRIHKNQLANDDTIILGDFNSNSIWDKTDRWWNHSDVIADLSAMNIESIYHNQFGEAQGNESNPTFYLHRNLEKPYHIDYAFVSKNLLTGSTISIGEKNQWLATSDHLPLIVEISI